MAKPTNEMIAQFKKMGYVSAADIQQKWPEVTPQKVSAWALNAKVVAHIKHGMYSFFHVADVEKQVMQERKAKEAKAVQEAPKRKVEVFWPTRASLKELVKEALHEVLEEVGLKSSRTHVVVDSEAHQAEVRAIEEMAERERREVER